MTNQDIYCLLSNWQDEIDESILKSNSLCAAMFSIDGNLLFSNPAFGSLLKKNPAASFMNPSFDHLVALPNHDVLIFDGYLTLGCMNSTIQSIFVQAYRKDDKILILGGMNNHQVLDQVDKMADLNREIINLQRELLKKNNSLESTLNDLHESNLRLQNEKQTRDKIFSVIAHDLRSPFNTIIGFSNILMNKFALLNKNDICEHAGIIHESAKNTLFLLDNLLFWAKSQTGEIKFLPRETNLYEIVEISAAIANPAAKYKEISISMHIPRNISIYVDNQLMNTIIRNLLTNSIKFTNRKGSIKIEAKINKEWAEIMISDNGIGMDELTLANLFTNSQTQSIKGTENEKGSGLGLKLCKEFIKKHGGNIWAESELGAGSKFTFTMPICK
ncbi:sensor histidine kinase [Marinifilum sp.]|uniref:sensor histidine kinase n=1 Tax=Marinifilum sp. TaxID=2033137 RepID=UPI003BAA63B9